MVLASGESEFLLPTVVSPVGGLVGCDGMGAYPDLAVFTTHRWSSVVEMSIRIGRGEVEILVQPFDPSV